MKKKAKIYYDKAVDALWIRIKKGVESDSQELAPGLTLEYNDKGEVIGIELLNASEILASISPRGSSPSKHYFA